MAYFKFVDSILTDTPINVFNNGNLKRDFTYVDDIVEGVKRVMEKEPTSRQQGEGLQPPDHSGSAPFRVYNIGNDTPIKLLDFVSTLEEIIGKKAIVELEPMQPGDVPNSRADVTDLRTDVGFSPDTDIKIGLTQFVEWYRDYYKC